jgi:hypothetical protein
VLPEPLPSTVSSTTESTSFNIKSNEFVPKGKLKKTQEAFPELGQAVEQAKKKTSAPVQPV